MSKVYHDKGFPATMLKASERRFPDDFVEVAEVASEELGEVYALTNHIDQDWTLNEGVKANGPCRSTSMGDVVVLSDGTVHLCCAVGWQAVGKINGEPLPLVFTNGGLTFSLLPEQGDDNEQ